MSNKSKLMNGMPAAAVLSIGLLGACPVVVHAGQPMVAVEGASFTINASMSQNLKSFIGKKINVTLDSGNVVSGIVKDVGDHLLHLEKLDGKEFYDALSRIEDIGAFDSRFRKLQR